MLKGMYLTVLVGQTIPLPIPKELLQGLDSVQVTSSAGQRSGFQISLDVPARSILAQAILTSGLYDPGARTIIVCTINGTPNVLMDGIVTRQEWSPSGDPGKSKVTLTGEDVSLAMNLTEVIPGMEWPGVPPEGRVAAIIAKYAEYGIVPIVIPRLFPDIDPPTDKIPTQRGTDLDYINDLAENAGYVFYVDPGPLPGMNVAYWGPQIRVGIPQPALNVDMGPYQNVESMSFSFDGLSATQYVGFVQEPATRIPIPVPIPGLDILNPPLAIRSVPKLRTMQIDTASDPIAEAISKSLARAARSSDSVTGSGSLDVLRYGQPLKSRGLVGVRGAGLSFDGLYYVNSVSHQIRHGEYKQSFSLVRNGLISITPAVPA